MTWILTGKKEIKMSNWSRAQLKDRAKSVLRQNYWIAFVVALILGIASGGGGGVSGSGTSYRTSFNETQQIGEGYNFETNYEYNDYQDFKELLKDKITPEMGIFMGLAALAATVAVAFGLALKIFVFNPLAAGCYKFYSSSAESPHNNMAPLGIGFKKGNYWGVVKAMFLKNLYIFLWSLLLVIPGIIKAYSYRMVPYIVTDNPQMDANDAITLSRNMMNGSKWKAFVLDLSFIGWYILGLLACGIGVIFVNPYKFSTDAQLYLVVRDKAIENNFTTPQMLNLTAN